MTIFEFADWRVSRQLMTEAEATEAIAWAELVEKPRKMQLKQPGLSIRWEVEDGARVTATVRLRNSR